MRYVRQAAVIGLIVAMPMSVLAKPGPLTPGGWNATDAVVLWYDPASGNVWATANDVKMTSFQLESKSGVFNVSNLDAGFKNGPFDVATKSKLFTLRTDGVTELSVGPVLPAGMSYSLLLEDLLIDGSLKPSGTFSDAPGGGPYIPTPEPSALALMLLGCAVLAHRVRLWGD